VKGISIEGFGTRWKYLRSWDRVENTGYFIDDTAVLSRRRFITPQRRDILCCQLPDHGSKSVCKTAPRSENLKVVFPGVHDAVPANPKMGSSLRRFAVIIQNDIEFVVIGVGENERIVKFLLRRAAINALYR